MEFFEKLRRVDWMRYMVHYLVKSANFQLSCFAITALLNLFPFVLGAQHTSIIVHDPVLIKQDSSYHLFCTGKGIASFTSSDLTDWRYEGPVFDSIPAWTRERVTDFEEHIWAPDISFHYGKFYLYYSVSSFEKNTSCIGLATNATLNRYDPEYHWDDQGVVIQSVPGRDQWNAIDPNLILDEEGTPWLVFGSFWEGVKLVKLNSDYTAPSQPEEWYTLARRNRSFEIPDKKPGDGAVEAPFIFYKNGYYYLFVSFDYCCRGIKSDYKIMVGRSTKIMGPYVDKKDIDMYYGGASLVIEGNPEWPGLGHNAVCTIGGVDYIVYHAYDAADEGRPKLIIKKIIWDSNDWPSVAIDN